MTGDQGPANLGDVIHAGSVIQPGHDAPRTRNITLLLATSVAIVMTGFGIIMPVFARRLGEFGSGVEALGLMTTAFALATFVAAPFMGALADRIGRRPLILLSLISFAVVNVGFLFARSTGEFTMLRVVEGLLTAGLMPAAMGIVADISPEDQRAQKTGIITAGMGLGIVFGPVLGGVLYDAWGFGAPFIASAALATLAFLFALVMVPETRPAAVRRREAMRRRRTSISSTPSENGRWAFMPRPRYVFGTLLLLDFVIVFEYTFVEPQMIFYFYEQLQWTTIQFGLVIAATGVAIVVSQALLSQISDRIGRKPVVIMGALLFTALPGALAFVTWYPMMLTLAAVAGVGLGLMLPALNAFYLDITQAQHRGRVQGVKASASSLGGVFGPLVLAGITSLIAPQGVFLAAGAILAATIAICLIGLREPDRTPHGEEAKGWQRSADRSSLAAATLRGISSRAIISRQSRL